MNNETMRNRVTRRPLGHWAKDFTAKMGTEIYRSKPDWVPQTREEWVNAFVKDVEAVKPGGKIRIFDGELDPSRYNDVLVLRALVVAKKEKDAVIEISTGPLVLTEPTVQTSLTFQGKGSRRVVNGLNEWLSPLREENIVETRIRGRGRNIMDIKGPQTTVASFIVLTTVPVEALTGAQPESA